MDFVLIRNILAMLIWQGSTYLVPLVTLPYLSRVLGLETFGHTAFAYAMVAYFVLVTDWGFSLSSSRLIARSRLQPDEVSDIFWNTLAAKSILAVVSIVVIIGLCFVFPSLAAVGWLLAPASLAIIANVLTVNWCLQGFERLDLFAGGSLAGKVATIPLIFWLVKSPADAWISVAIQTGGLVFSGLLSLVLVARLKVITWSRPTLGKALRQIASSWHPFLSTAAVTIYTQGNTVVLGAIVGTGNVGQYAGADRLSSAAQGVLRPISNSVYPRIARLYAEDTQKAYAFVRRLAVLQSLGALCISIALCALAPLVVRIILGSEFAEAAKILRWLAWLPFIVGVGNVFGLQVLLQTGHQRLLSRIILAAAPFSLAIIIPLVLTLGPIGAAVALVTTEAAVTIGVIAAAYQTNPKLFQRRA